MRVGTIGDLKVGDIFKVERWMDEAINGASFAAGITLQKTSTNGCKFPGDTGPEPYQIQPTYTPYIQRYGEAIRLHPVNIYIEEEITTNQRIGWLKSRVNSLTGADPEIFVVHGEDMLLPAFKFLQDKKTANTRWDKILVARRLGLAGDNAIAYWDGFAAEFKIYQRSCHGYLMDCMREGLQRVHKAAKAFDATAKLTVDNTFNIPSALLEEATDDQVELGCGESFNAYGDVVQFNNHGRLHPLRSAGGHIHFAIRAGSTDEVVDMVKGCDLISALPAVAIFADIDRAERRRYYGRAGEFRRPAHGLEYRVLSNAWLCHPKAAHLIFNLTRAGLKVGRGGYAEKLGLRSEETREIINNCDVPRAKKFVLDNLDLFVTLIANDGALCDKRALAKIVDEGVGGLFPTYKNIAANWHLDGEWRGHSNDSAETWGKVTA